MQSILNLFSHHYIEKEHHINNVFFLYFVPCKDFISYFVNKLISTVVVFFSYRNTQCSKYTKRGQKLKTTGVLNELTGTVGV